MTDEESKIKSALKTLQDESKGEWKLTLNVPRIIFLNYY